MVTQREVKMSGFVLDRKLQSVGNEVFVKYYDLFCDYANGSISRADCIDRLVRDNVSVESGAEIRIGNAKLIFDANMGQEALDIARVRLAKRRPR